MSTTTHRDAVPPSAGASAPRLDVTTGARWYVGLASAVAGVIHLTVVPEHLEEWWVHGTFFLVVGCFQVGLAALLMRRPTWPVALTGMAVNLGVVLVYVASRTTGLPVHPPEDITSHEWSHGHEGVGAADLTATGAELVVVCLLVTLLPPRLRRVATDVMIVTAAGLVVLRLSGSLG